MLRWGSYSSFTRAEAVRNFLMSPMDETSAMVYSSCGPLSEAVQDVRTRVMVETLSGLGAVDGRSTALAAPVRGPAAGRGCLQRLLGRCGSLLGLLDLREILRLEVLVE